MPDIYQRQDVIFGHVVTFFIKRLTGAFVIDPSNASFTGLYDTVGYGDWSTTILEDLRIDKDKLPEVAMSPTVVGTLDKRISKLTGIANGTNCQWTTKDFSVKKNEKFKMT